MKMRASARIGLIVAALLPMLAFAGSLWRIQLEAPQYPEGIGLAIWINTIAGQKPNDLNSINGLNHYIGMKAIVPDAIPELRWTPIIVTGLAAMGLLAASFRRRWALYAWTVSFALIAAAGLFDFWYWGYDYGHDLDPTAAIKIPGLSYQPPLIGSKQLLNFTAHSWPGLGGCAIALGLVLAAILCVREARQTADAHALRRVA
jgi:copper chaperone NosL